MTDQGTPEQTQTLVQVSLLTGFLGSGKTTLLNRLIKHPKMGDTAVLVNEFGEIGLDHQLVEKIDEETVLLNAGCLCCTVRGDLARALRELFVKRVKGDIPPINRVLIETTGLADPAPIIHTLMTDPVISHRFALDGVITTVDAVNGALQLGEHTESIKQAAVADRIVMTKCDIAAPDDIAGLEQSLKDINPGAPIVRAVLGDIDPDALFNAGLYNPDTKSADVRRWLRDEAYLVRDSQDEHDHGHGGDHQHGHDPNRHSEKIRAYCITHDRPLHWNAFVAWIRTMIEQHGDRLLRIKGIVNIKEQDLPIAVHGVQHLFHDPVQLPEWPDDDRRSRIVMITRDLDQALVESKLDEFQKAAETQQN